MSFAELATQLVDVARQCHARGWALGTGGNLSAVVGRDPLRLAITASGVDKSSLSAADIVQIDGDGRVKKGSGRPSAEASLHLAITRACGAGAVLHTHSIWATLLSDAGEGLAIEGYEMLKGLDGVVTHQHREWLPILDNTQDWPAAVPQIEAMLRQQPNPHGFLIRRHGLYTWSRNLAGAKRHLEVLEFLFEVIGRKRGTTWQT